MRREEKQQFLIALVDKVLPEEPSQERIVLKKLDSVAYLHGSLALTP
jgi:hypothetical protein